MKPNTEKSEPKKLDFTPSKKFWIKTPLITIGVIFVLCALLVGGASAYEFYYKDKVYSGIKIGQYNLGGMTEDEVKELIENFNNRISKEGIKFNYLKNNQPGTFTLTTVLADDSSVDLIRLNSDDIARAALSYGRTGSWLLDTFEPLDFAVFHNQTVASHVIVEDAFVANLRKQLASIGDAPHNANVDIASINPLDYNIIPEVKGALYDAEVALSEMRLGLANLVIKPIELAPRDFMPDVKVADVQFAAAKLPQIFAYGDLKLSYIDPNTNERRDWIITPAIFSKWLEVRKMDSLEAAYALSQDKVKAYLETLRPIIDVAARDARFAMENKRVKEFQGSQSGISLNLEKTYSDLDTVFRDRNYQPTSTAQTVTISTDIVKPSVEMSQINNLGITDVIGAGVSTFKDSHTNRIKNIANAVKRLNGVLIAPGEVFSANKYAGPYTSESGFLPEQVIKGDEIKLEIGGGMCQIGTTLFRMAMNSGMPIVERRNHSLVVGYYADPVNGNPGTDATLYEPSVDFKFLNDTGNYLLLETKIDYKKQQLIFTLWGKNDGRKGSYTHPKVSKWIPSGEVKEIQVSTLKPGQKKCQAAFRGAVASFVYTRVTPAGETVERVFDSYYRPLPGICLIGANATSTPAETDGSAASSTESQIEILPVETTTNSPNSPNF